MVKYSFLYLVTPHPTYEVTGMPHKCTFTTVRARTHTHTDTHTDMHKLTHIANKYFHTRVF